jgi:hypothetical protein
LIDEVRPVQGNLDPLALLAGGTALDRSIDAILAAFSQGPFIFNLAGSSDVGDNVVLCVIVLMVLFVVAGAERSVFAFGPDFKDLKQSSRSTRCRMARHRATDPPHIHFRIEVE